jgi:raffinose/stachyose/melibiose transport system substrate-binding protein
MTGGHAVDVQRRLFALLAVMALLLAACSGGGTATPSAAESAAPPSEAAPTEAAPTEAAAEPVTVEFYDLHINEPGRSLLQSIIDEFEAANPGVTIEWTNLENEALKAKIATEMQAGNPPDLFQSWGGGVLAQQVEAGMARAIDADIADWKDTMNPGAMSIYQVDGVQYGIPYNFGLVGFWYNKDLFAEAGISEPATTWGQFLTDVQKLKDAGITPISVGAGDKWPAMFYWAYLALRAGGQAALEEAVATGNWSVPAFITAGNELKKLIDMDPFQDSFLAATYPQMAGTMGNGKAAMELMGQWAPGVEKDNSESKEGIGDALGWFLFPELEGGAGLATDVFGGADGFAVGRDAPPEAVAVLEYLVSLDVAKRWGGLNDGTLPPTNGAEEAVTDPFLTTVLQKRAEATYAQLYLDQATSPELGAAINDAIQTLFAGTASPEEVAQAITDAAAAAN